MNELDGPLLAEDNNKKQTEPKKIQILKKIKILQILIFYLVLTVVKVLIVILQIPVQ